METSTLILTSSSLSVIVLSGTLYLFKNTFTSWLWKEHSIEIEKAKSSMLKTTEALKFDFQKDAMRLQILTSSIFVIYPEIFQKIRIAHGAVGRIYGFRYSNTWIGYDQADFDAYLSEKKIPSGAKANLLSEISIDHDDGLKKLNHYLWNLEFSEAEAAILDLKNYLLIKEIYIEKDICDLSFEIQKLLSHARIKAQIAKMDMSNNKHLEEMQTKIDEAVVLIDKVRDKIKIQLNPVLNTVL